MMFKSIMRCSMNIILNNKIRYISYIQGQSPEPNSREYFYFIDHQGMLFLDDAKIKNFTSCFKDKKFLQFFFKRLKVNDTGKYELDFPYYSPCGREKNFVRCDDLPIVFTHIIQESTSDVPMPYLSYGHAGELLKIKFQPEKIAMLPENGRVYHPGPESIGGVGLIKSSLAAQLSSGFIYANNGSSDDLPLSLSWLSKKYDLTNEILPKLYKLQGKI
ncbi:UPF0598 protein CG30010 [Parasteatoda tepidariorum]|uniref:UPF0598 protein CG30010 n=1 Tax=Parasteatoda tepidariorum TaxID=114398 RepID=UPI00077F90DA|nr:UPF0598 protein CG30010 [Parasteatoda tepidariorum]